MGNENSNDGLSGGLNADVKLVHYPLHQGVQRLAGDVLKVACSECILGQPCSSQQYLTDCKVLNHMGKELYCKQWLYSCHNNMKNLSINSHSYEIYNHIHQE